MAFVQGYGLSGRYTKECIDLIREACANIAVSEFKQLDHVLDLSTSPEDYLDMSGANRWAICCGMRKCSNNCWGISRAIASPRSIWDGTGIAFQLMDDLLDLRGDERMGKPRGKDVLEGKMTLPLITP